MNAFTLMRRIILQALTYYNITFNFGSGVYVNYLGAMISLTILSMSIYHITRLFKADNGKD